jgi:hypothetical protein
MALSDVIIGEYRFGKDLEGSDRGLIKALSWYFTEGTEKCYRLIHRQNSHAPRGWRHTGRCEAQSRKLVKRVKKNLD